MWANWRHQDTNELVAVAAGECNNFAVVADMLDDVDYHYAADDDINDFDADVAGYDTDFGNDDPVEITC